MLANPHPKPTLVVCCLVPRPHTQHTQTQGRILRRSSELFQSGGVWGEALRMHLRLWRFHHLEGRFEDVTCPDPERLGHKLCISQKEAKGSLLTLHMQMAVPMRTCHYFFPSKAAADS